ncbi:uncharacterized protein LOC115460640 [Microcaecilia unicolor]|uniref:Uncharacterized protein LOC115460640 n=1 Tax=Microcaecilia unicolor TaxID=1415580 RepID=A0A6P7WYP8_9AMPH|nr:uncharacterized protein LOC115460640 [Microcaecilia unicolor]
MLGINHLVLQLVFLEVAGKIYFLQKQEDHPIKCNQSDDDHRTIWYTVDDIKWGITPLNCTSQEQSQNNPEDNRNLCCADTALSDRLPSNLLRNRIFACQTFMEECMPNSNPSLVGNHSKYNIFVIGEQSLNQDNQKISAIGNISGSLSIKAEKNIILPCTFNRFNQHYALCWLKYANEECIYFFTNVDGENVHDFVDEIIQKRIHRMNSLNESTSYEPIQNHSIEIRNATASDSGMYLCLVSIWMQNKFEWKTISNFSVHVDGKTKTDTSLGKLYTAVGAVGGIMFIIGIIILFLYLKKKKSQGKLSEPHRGNSSAETLDNDDCLPYAIGFESNLQHSPEVLYSLVNKPQNDPLGQYSEVKLEAEPNSQPTDAMCVAYSVVNIKDAQSNNKLE